MGISLHPERLKRYKDIARLLFKYGRSDLVTRAGLDDALQGMSSANVFAVALEAKEFMAQLPGRVNKLLDAVTNNEVKLKIEILTSDTPASKR